MRKSIVAASLVLAAGLVLAVSTSPFAKQFTPRDETPEEYPAHPNRDDAFYACVACHAFKLVAQQGMNRRQWDESIQLMVDKHNMPALDDKERQAVLDYLETAFPQRAPTAAPGGWKNPFAPR
jgi:mono/diheme cytochrome c family protein